jgi:hypothetical protein
VHIDKFIVFLREMIPAQEQNASRYYIENKIVIIINEINNRFHVKALTALT